MTRETAGALALVADEPELRDALHSAWRLAPGDAEVRALLLAHDDAFSRFEAELERPDGKRVRTSFTLAKGCVHEKGMVLRLYSTAAFRALNGPMRQLKMSNYRKGEDGRPLPLEPPQLAAPHPQPATPR